MPKVAYCVGGIQATLAHTVSMEQQAHEASEQASALQVGRAASCCK